MTPAARLSAAIEALDHILEGEPAEKVLTRWARASRFAGSKDRAAVRDIVFDCLRQLRSFAHRGGGKTGRALVLAQQYQEGIDLDTVFTGERFAPEPLTTIERQRVIRPSAPPNMATALDFPDFLEHELRRSLGVSFQPVLAAMQSRAPVDIRVNLLKTTREAAQELLRQDGIETEPHYLAETALRVKGVERGLPQTEVFKNGFIELQDVSSQAVALFCGVKPKMDVLDYCAGGGGKTLALAALMKNQGRLYAHDVAPIRMNNLPERAERAGAQVNRISPVELAGFFGGFDLVLADAPCSGSGAWRRTPDAKWKFMPENLKELVAIQNEVLEKCAAFTKNGGYLAYATCSLLRSENHDRVRHFLAQHEGWSLLREKTLTPALGGDGFYVAVMQKSI